MSGCLKLLFSPSSSRVDGIIINSSGGLTSGDQITLKADVEDSTILALTTQAAERAYRADAGAASVETRLSVGRNAQLLWLPQELILFDGAKLSRKLSCDLAPDAKAIFVEPIVFGRRAMGERLREIDFKDRISITRDGVPLYSDALHLDTVDGQTLARPAVARKMGAMATVVYIAADAETRTKKIQRDLPNSAGASLIRDDVMVLRALASDGFALRQFLVPILDALTGDTLPKSWRL